MRGKDIYIAVAVLPAVKKLLEEHGIELVSVGDVVEDESDYHYAYVRTLDVRVDLIRLGLGAQVSTRSRRKVALRDAP